MARGIVKAARLMAIRKTVGQRAMSARIVRVALGSAFIVISVSQLQAASWLEKNFWLSGPRYNRVMPGCEYPPALDRIIGNFHTNEARFWNSKLEIVGIENIARPR